MAEVWTIHFVLILYDSAYCYNNIKSLKNYHLSNTDSHVYYINLWEKKSQMQNRLVHQEPRGESGWRWLTFAKVIITQE